METDRIQPGDDKLMRDDLVWYIGSYYTWDNENSPGWLIMNYVLMSRPKKASSPGGSKYPSSECATWVLIERNLKMLE